MNDDDDLMDPPRLVDDARASEALRALVRETPELVADFLAGLDP